MASWKLTRRNLLRAVATGSGAGIVGGIGTNALLTDTEGFSGNAMNAGTLGLRVATAASRKPGDGWSPSLRTGNGSSETQHNVSLTKKSGSIGIAMVVCGNPGLIDLHVPADSTRFPTDARGTLVLQHGDTQRVLAQGYLKTIIDRHDTIPLTPNCTKLGRIHGTDIKQGAAFSFDGTSVEITDVYTKSTGAVTGVDLDVTGAKEGVCQVNVKGGGKPIKPNKTTANQAWGSGVHSYLYQCATSASKLYAPTNNGGQQSAISHIDLYGCRGRPCVGCTPDKPLKFFFQWADTVDSSKSEIGFTVTATQCRHHSTTSQ